MIGLMTGVREIGLKFRSLLHDPGGITCMILLNWPYDTVTLPNCMSDCIMHIYSYLFSFSFLGHPC